MKLGRLTYYILIMFATAPVFADNISVVDDTSKVSVKSVDNHGKETTHTIDYNLRLPEYVPDKDITFTDQTSLTYLPPGSLRIEYRGLYKPIMRQVYRRFQKFWHDSLKEQINFMSDAEIRQELFEQETAWIDHVNGGQWWTRSWIFSLNPDNGGAPAKPYVHIIGTNTEWRAGPLTISNTLKLKFDYIAIFKFEEIEQPTPLSPYDLHNKPSLELDVRTIFHVKKSASKLRIKIRPRVKLGSPKGNDYRMIARTIAIRMDIMITTHKRRSVNIECEARVKEMREFMFSANAALVYW